VSGGRLGPTTLTKSEALDHGSQCCIDWHGAVLASSAPVVGRGRRRDRCDGFARGHCVRAWRAQRYGHVVVGRVVNRCARPEFSAAGHDRALPVRCDDQGRHPRGVDRRGVLPGLSCRKSVDGQPAQDRSVAAGALFGDGSGLAIGDRRHVECPVGGADAGTAGGRDHRRPRSRRRRMRVAAPRRIELLHN
jgi:hypothetical protein